MAIKNNSILDTSEVSAQDLISLQSSEVDIISSPQEFEEMSLSLVEEQKKTLKNLRQRVMLQLDKKKLEQSTKLMTAMENIQDIWTDREILERVKGNVKTAMDLKCLAEAYTKLADAQQKLSRLDTIDGSGTGAKMKLAIQFDNGNGTKVQTYVEAGE